MQTKRYHIICDLKNCNEKIKDKQALREFLESLVKMLNMTILEGPIIAEGLPENPGLSAVVIIDYSDISVHSFTKYDEALIDIFSCKEFNKEIAIDYCLKFFGVDKEKSRIKQVWWG